MKRLLAALLTLLPVSIAAEENAQPVEVVGVVDALGPSVASGYAGSDWTGAIMLIAWRIDGGAPQTGRLQLKLALSKDRKNHDAFLDRFKSGNLIRVRTVDSPRPLASWIRADIAEVMIAGEDEELARIAEPILRPPPYEHDVLGTFTAHERLPWEYGGEAIWNGQPVALHLFGKAPVADHAQLAEQAETAQTILAQEEALTTSLETMLIERLYTVWLESWRGPGEPVLNEQEWLKRIKMFAIYPYADGMIEFELEDGGLFGGHHIIAAGTLDEGFTAADLVG